MATSAVSAFLQAIAGYDGPPCVLAKTTRIDQDAQAAFGNIVHFLPRSAVLDEETQGMFDEMLPYIVMEYGSPQVGTKRKTAAFFLKERGSFAHERIFHAFLHPVMASIYLSPDYRPSSFQLHHSVNITRGFRTGFQGTAGLVIYYGNIPICVIELSAYHDQSTEIDEGRRLALMYAAALLHVNRPQLESLTQSLQVQALTRGGEDTLPAKPRVQVRAIITDLTRWRFLRVLPNGLEETSELRVDYQEDGTPAPNQLEQMLQYIHDFLLRWD